MNTLELASPGLPFSYSGAQSAVPRTSQEMWPSAKPKGERATERFSMPLSEDEIAAHERFFVNAVAQEGAAHRDATPRTFADTIAAKAWTSLHPAAPEAASAAPEDTAAENRLQLLERAVEELRGTVERLQAKNLELSTEVQNACDREASYQCTACGAT